MTDSKPIHISTNEPISFLLWLSNIPLGLLPWLSGKNTAYNAGDLGLIPGSRRSPGGRNGNPLQYSCLEKSHGQRSLVDHSPWGFKKLDMTKQRSGLPFPGSSAGKESACNAGDPSLIPGLGRFPGEGIGYPL